MASPLEHQTIFNPVQLRGPAEAGNPRADLGEGCERTGEGGVSSLPSWIGNAQLGPVHRGAGARSR
ncbi:MAG: hypothetical protein AAGI51_09135 [Pseudomonadota bacterium]